MNLTNAHNQCGAKHANSIVASRKDDETDHPAEDGSHDAVKGNLGHLANQGSCDHDASDCCPELVKRHIASLNQDESRFLLCSNLRWSLVLIEQWYVCPIIAVRDMMSYYKNFARLASQDYTQVSVCLDVRLHWYAALSWYVKVLIAKSHTYWNS